MEKWEEPTYEELGSEPRTIGRDRSGFREFIRTIVFGIALILLVIGWMIMEMIEGIFKPKNKNHGNSNKQDEDYPTW
jgi:hypothetical protein